MENNFLVKEDNYFLKELKDTYPIGLIISLYDLYNQQKKLIKYSIKTKALDSILLSLLNLNQKKFIF